MAGDSSPSVLVADDDEEILESYAAVLRESYAVETATDGDEALEIADADTDVALLDRQMPRMSGDDVLEELQRRNLDVRTALVTGVSPDFDIIELGFDDYVVKPVEPPELEGLVERLLALDEYEAVQQEYSSLEVKREVLKAEKEDGELAASEEYADLEDRIDDLGDRLADLEAEHGIEDYHAP